MLIPAAVLVLVILGAIAVDSSLAFLGQRELNTFTTQAANDAAAASLDQGAFYNQGRIAIDPQRADDVVASLRRNIGSSVHDVHVTVTATGNQITVSADGTVDDLFATVLPGARHQWHVRASSSATVRQLAVP
jgi:hypothetical protein